MRQVDLIRLEESDDGTFGTLRIDGKAFCVTLEPPDRNNMQNISNIPPGEYTCKRYSSPNYPNTFEITDVPGRDKVLFHAGNWVSETRGCVLLGQHYAKLRGERAIANSGNTFRSFMQELSDEQEFKFKIVEV